MTATGVVCPSFAIEIHLLTISSSDHGPTRDDGSSAESSVSSNVSPR